MGSHGIHLLLLIIPNHLLKNNVTRTNPEFLIYGFRIYFLFVKIDITLAISCL